MRKRLEGLEKYRLLFEHSNDAQYILDRQSNKIILANKGMQRITGYSTREITFPDFKLASLIYKEDLDKWRKIYSQEPLPKFLIYELRLVRKKGKVIDTEVSVHNLEFDGRPIRIGSIRNITEKKALERRLKEKLDQEKRRTLEIAKSNTRIYQLTEKIRNTPKLTQRLLKIQTESELFQEAGKLLREKEGLNYKDVIFLLLKDNFLEVVYSTKTIRKKKYNILEIEHPYSQVFNKGNIIEHKNEIIIPIIAKEKTLGVAVVFFNKDERVLFDENEMVKEGQKNILTTIVEIIGLCLDELRLYQKVERESIVDELTQLYNRRYFDRVLKEEISRATRYKRELSLLYLDIDDFKPINDNFGHRQGDMVLKELASLVLKSTRKADLAFRHGGEEFAIILPETGIKGAITKAGRLRRQVEGYSFSNISKHNKPVSATISIGVAGVTKDITSEEELFKNLDSALYRAKREGKNCVRKA